jgi:hypothetical protein
MKITLACPSEWFERPGLGDAGETVDVDGTLGDQLVREGYARGVDVAQLSGADVDQVAAAEGVDLSGAHTVAEKKAAVKAARESKEG